MKSLSNKWGHAIQGNDYGIKGTNTIQFIYRRDVPQDKQVTYVSYVCNFIPLKDKPYCMHITVGRDRLDYEYDLISDADKGAQFSRHPNRII